MTDDVDVAGVRPTENTACEQLNAHEEAVAVRTMLDPGLGEDGAAPALGVVQGPFDRSVKLPELPEKAQRMVGDGSIQLTPGPPWQLIYARNRT